MNYQHLLPHVFSALSLLEVQYNTCKESSSKNDLLPGEKIELKNCEKIIAEMKKTANLFQLSNAKNFTLESHRLIQIFYGLLWIVRPSVLRLCDELELRSTNSTQKVSSRRIENTINEIDVRENAH